MTDHESIILLKGKAVFVYICIIENKYNYHTYVLSLYNGIFYLVYRVTIYFL